MKKITAITLFQTSAGCRMSMVYADINEEGVVIKDNARVDRILMDAEAVEHAEKLLAHAQTVIDGLEG